MLWTASIVSLQWIASTGWIVYVERAEASRS